jgi:hypothetical protein
MLAIILNAWGKYKELIDKIEESKFAPDDTSFISLSTAESAFVPGAPAGTLARFADTLDDRSGDPELRASAPQGETTVIGGRADLASRSPALTKMQ